MAAPPDRGTQYTAFIEAELKRESDRRESINTRAAAGLTGTTALATLVLAVFAVVIGREAIVNTQAKVCLTVAVVALLAASACALQAGRARAAEILDIEPLKEMLNEKHWLQDSEPDARWQSSNLMIKEIDLLRQGSTARGAWLRSSAILQVVAVAALGVATVFVAFTQHPPDSNANHPNQGNVSQQQNDPTSSKDCKPPLTLFLLC